MEAGVPELAGVVVVLLLGALDPAQPAKPVAHNTAITLWILDFARFMSTLLFVSCMPLTLGEAARLSGVQSYGRV
jgi:hypothetical protein